jgi:hypothetical protein
VSPFYTYSSEYQFTLDNWGTNPSTTPGTQVTPGSSNVEGAWTDLFSSATLAQECYGFMLWVHTGAGSTRQRNHLVDVGVDPAGGSSYSAIISNIVAGYSGIFATTIVPAGHKFFFPMRVPAGATIAARVQGSDSGTPGTVRIAMKLYGQPSAPWTMPCGQISETIGTITNSSGVSFTPGNAADGTWTSLGTTSRDLWWFQLAYQLNSNIVTAETTYIELGAGASGSQRVLIRRFHMGVATEGMGDLADSQLNWFEGYHRIPSGTELWVRGRCENAPDSGYEAVAIGVG